MLGAGTMIVFGLGRSSWLSEPVSQAVFERLPASVELLVAAFVAAIAIGGIAGLTRARSRVPVVRGAIAAAALVCRTIPVVTATLLIQVAMVFMPLLPRGVPSAETFDLRDRLAFLLAPVVVLAVPFGAWVSVIFYERFRTSGAPRIVRRDVMATIAATAALIGPALMCAAMLIEPLFSWPGVARDFSGALRQYDVRLIAGFIVLYLTAILAVELCTGSARAAEPSPSERDGRLSRAGVAACGTLLVVVLGAVAAPLIAPVGPYYIDLAHWLGYPLAPGTAGHPLGTDENGRDLLARLLFGLRTSLVLTAAATLVATVLAALAAKAFGSVRWIGTGRALGATAIRPFAGLPLILVAFVAIDATTHSTEGPSQLAIVLMIAAVSWPAGIAAFRASGARRVSGIVGLAGAAFLLETTISSIGFGVQPPVPSLGNMLVNAFVNVFVAPAIVIAPCTAIVVVLGALYAFADALREMPERRSPQPSD